MAKKFLRNPDRFWGLVLSGMAGAVILAILLTAGLSVNRGLVFWGLTSFSIALFFIMLLTLFFAIFQTWILRKRYPISWNRRQDKSLDLKDRLDAQSALEKVDDPDLRKFSRWGSRAAFIILGVWFVVFLTVALGTWAFKISIFVKLMEHFK